MIGLALLTLASAAQRLERWDFEADDGGLTVVDPDQQWEWGAFPEDYGPRGGLTGSAGWATVLDSAYFNDVEAWLVLPTHDLSGAAHPMLELVHWYALADGDVVNLQVDQGGSLSVLEPVYSHPVNGGFSGSSGGWVRAWYDLAGVLDSGDLSLHLETDSSVQTAGWYVDEISLWDGDIAPPKLSGLTQLPDTEDVDGPYLVEVTAQENDATLGLVLFYTVGDGTEEATLMSASGAVYEGEIPGSDEPGVVVSYYVRANDGSNVVFAPDEGALSFEVRLLPPEQLVGPEGRIVDTEAVLEWAAPDSIHPLEGYRVYRGDEALFDCVAPWAIVPLVGGGDDTYSVSALYDLGEAALSESGRSAEVSLEVALPRVLELAPASAWQGDTVRVAVTGEYLLLEHGDVEAGLGAGVEVLDVEVSNVDEAVLVLAIDADAPLGTRNLELRSGAVLLNVEAAFDVVDGADRPRLLSIEPEALRQGDRDTLRVTASSAFAELPLVDLGDGVLIEEVSLISDTEVDVRVVIEPRAALGERPVVLDDSARLLEGVRFRVRDAVPQETGRCQGAPPAGWLGLLLVVSALVGRRRELD